MTARSLIYYRKGNSMKKVINVVGLGYIGTPTAFMLSCNGYSVIGTDSNESVINRFNKKEMPYSEPGLYELMENAVRNGISYSLDCVKADAYIIAVPTPFIRTTRRIDTSYLETAVKAVYDICPEGAIIAIESTISPGTIDNHIRPLVKGKKKVFLAHVPERIIPGKIVQELSENDRTIGCDEIEVGKELKAMYSSFCCGRITITDIKTAEMTKVVENTYRDINIAFANELTKICDSAGLDVHEVIRIANRHPRVNILSPGPGVGGHCISVDPWFLVGDYPGLANIILAARKINDSMPEYVLSKVSTLMNRFDICDIERVGFYGLTYKENVDDIRESPTLQLIECMKMHLAKGAAFYDPFINEKIVDNQFYSLVEFLAGIELVVIMVGHQEIIEKQCLLRDKVVFDTRNVLHDINTEKL